MAIRLLRCAPPCHRSLPALNSPQQESLLNLRQQTALSPDNVSSHCGCNHQTKATVAAAASSPRCYHGKRQNRGLSLTGEEEGDFTESFCLTSSLCSRSPPPHLPETKPNRLVRRRGAKGREVGRGRLDKLYADKEEAGGKNI